VGALTDEERKERKERKEEYYVSKTGSGRMREMITKSQEQGR
jgi:hypothetical protein